FFFSSRRRHTRFSRDWSSDVCSSDLGEGTIMADPNRWFSLELEEGCSKPSRCRGCPLYDAPGPVWGYGPRQTDTVLIGEAPGQEIGRAPCRGKGESPAGAEPRHKRIE